MALTFAASASEGKRVKSVTIGGKPLIDDKQYTFSGCERAGEPLDVVCRLRGVHDVHVATMSVHEGLRAYMKLPFPRRPRRQCWKPSDLGRLVSPPSRRRCRVTA